MDVNTKQVDHELRKAGTQVKRGLRHALAIGCYNSQTDDEIGRSKEHAKHMRRTRRRNFATKMSLIDPHYGKKAAAVLGAGTVLGLAATTVPTVGVALGPTVGGAIIAGGLAYIETDAHRKVGDHALLDSLLDDRGDNINTNSTLIGYDGHGDRVSSFDLAQVAEWSDSDDEEFANLLPPSLGGKATLYEDEEGISLSKASNLDSEPELTDAFDILGLRSDSNKAAGKTTHSAVDFFSLDSSANSSTSPYSSSGSASAPKISSSNDFFDLLSVPAPAPAAKPAVPRPPSPELVSGGSFDGGARFKNPHATPTLQVLENPALKPAIQLEPPAPPKDDFFASLLEPTPLQPTKVPLSPAGSFSDSVSSGTDGIPEQISAKLQQNARASHHVAVSSPQQQQQQQPLLTQQQQGSAFSSGSGLDFFASLSSPQSSSNSSPVVPQQQQTTTSLQSSFFSTSDTSPQPQPHQAAPQAQASADPFADLYLRAAGASPAGSFDASNPLF